MPNSVKPFLRIFKYLLITGVFIFLTILTQIGGIIYLLSFCAHKYINRKWNNRWLRNIFKFLSFLITYIVATFFIVPILAKPFGRVSLPFTKTGNIQPLNFMTCFLNRQYVRLELKETATEVAKQMNKKFPGTVVNYLDANFPFINQFPLFPHLSHNDGKKLDLAFCYIDKVTGKQTNKVPSPIGYGICEEPRTNEINTAEFCDEKGYWQYSLMRKIIPQGNKKSYEFDSVRTRELVNLFIEHPSINKIFIEPHLKLRLRLNDDKIRFHGCHAVRHDDHIHVQIK